MPLFSQEQIERANKVSILDYLQKSGYHPVKTGRNYELKGYGGLQVDSNRNQWNCLGNPSKDARGGPIQLVSYLEHIDWKEAVGQLIKEEGVYQQAEIRKSSLKTIKEFILPEKNNTYQHIFAYLIKSRKIDSEIVKDLVERKLLYENNKKSCVFVGKDKEGTVKYANIRSTNTIGEAFKGEASGSDKRFGFCVPGDGKVITIFEAPIDVLSYMTIFKRKGGYQAVEKETLLALGGVEDLALEQYLHDHPNIKEIKMALDMDDTGNRGCKNIAEKYHSRYEIKRLVLPCKDYNQYLVENYNQIVSGGMKENRKNKEQDETKVQILHKEFDKPELEPQLQNKQPKEVRDYFECYAINKNKNGKYVIMALKSNHIKIVPITWPMAEEEKAKNVLDTIVLENKKKGICVEKVESMTVLNGFYNLLTEKASQAEKLLEQEFEPIQ